MSLLKKASSDFPVKRGLEIAPRRRGGRGVKEFLIKKFSELCDSVVNTSSQETRNNLKN
jgi:hypothetical protein